MTTMPPQLLSLIPAVLGGFDTLVNANLNNSINQQNYQLQKDVFEYQKDLQEKIFAREDNAVQRRVKDLQKAGLSKTLAAGSSAGAGQAVSVTTPQMSNQMRAGISDAIQNGLSTFGELLSQDNMKKQTEKTSAETNNIIFTNKILNQELISKINTNALFEKQVLKLDLENAKSQAEKEKIESEIKKLDQETTNKIKEADILDYTIDQNAKKQELSDNAQLPYDYITDSVVNGNPLKAVLGSAFAVAKNGKEMVSKTMNKVGSFLFGSVNGESRTPKEYFTNTWTDENGNVWKYNPKTNSYDIPTGKKGKPHK